MPSRNQVKTYIKGAYYHIYNRGVEKKDIFHHEKDYLYFLNKVEDYLQDNPTKIDVLAYCLMPNHYHLLVQNKTDRSIEKFIRSIATSYAQYVNKKYQRIGHLFQSSYKAALLKEDIEILNLSRYIHRNPISKNNLGTMENYKYSSYKKYTTGEGSSWVNTQPILSYFGKTKTKAQKLYTKFIRIIPVSGV